MSAHPSVLQDDYVVVRLRETVTLRGRFLAKYGPHGTLRTVHCDDALLLVESNRAKLPAGVKLRALREHIAAIAEPEQTYG